MTEKDSLLLAFAKCNDYTDPLTLILYTRLKQVCSDTEILNYMLLVGKWVKKDIQ